MNEVYVTVVYEGQATRMTDANIFLHGVLRKFSNAYLENYLNSGLQELTSTTEKMMGVLELYGARRLGVVKRKDTYY